MKGAQISWQEILKSGGKGTNNFETEAFSGVQVSLFCAWDPERFRPAFPCKGLFYRFFTAEKVSLAKRYLKRGVDGAGEAVPPRPSFPGQTF